MACIRCLRGLIMAYRGTDGRQLNSLLRAAESDPTLLESARLSEEAAASLGADLRDTVTGMRQKMPDLATHDVVLIGWPESREGPECWLAVDHAKWGPPSFQAICVSGVVSPDNGRLAARMGGRHVHEDPTFNPETEAAALIEAQGAISAACVGAFVQLTTIRRDRIETRIVQWFVDQFELRPAMTAASVNAFAEP